MNSKEVKEGEFQTNSLVEGFHRVSSLIPLGQVLITVDRDTRVADALQIMDRNQYSQLPVMGGSALLGVFSYRSFSKQALLNQKSHGKEWLGDLPVDEFLEDAHCLNGNEDWTKIQQQLDAQDFFFVGHPDKVEGLVTTMDVYNYFKEIADPFILIAEIELALRRIVTACIPVKQRTDAFKHCLTGAYAPRKVPHALIDLTLGDLVQIVSAREHWSYFEDILGSKSRSRNYAVDKLKPLADWRNDSFHFRRELEEYEIAKLVDCRNWLHRCVRAFEGQRRENCEDYGSQFEQASNIPQYSIMNLQRLLAECEGTAAAFFTWILDEAEHRQIAVSWTLAGFTLSLDHSELVRPFASCSSPDIFEVFLEQGSTLNGSEIDLWREELVLAGLTKQVGKLHLRAEIGPENVSQIVESFSNLMNKLVGSEIHLVATRSGDRVQEAISSTEPHRGWMPGETYDERLARIRSVYPRAYESWSAEEEEKLQQLVKRARSTKEIAACLQRQPSAIRSRIKKLGI